MTGQEMERAIEFLLQSQAKNDAQIGVLTERVDQLTQDLAETNRLIQLHAETQTEFIQVVTRSLAALNDAVVRVNAKVDAADASAKARFDALDARAREWADAADAADARARARAEATDARLDRLAATVERIITGRSDQPPGL